MNALEPSSCAAALRGPKQRRPAAAKASTTPMHQRPFGPDDGEPDLFGLRERHEAGDVLGGDVDVAHARLGGGAAVAGRHQNFGNLR